MSEGVWRGRVKKNLSCKVSVYPVCALARCPRQYEDTSTTPPAATSTARGPGLRHENRQQLL